MKKQQHKQIEEIEKEISPSEYMKMLKGIDLRDVYLKDVSSRLNTREISHPAKLKLDEDFKIIKNDNKEAVIESKYSLSAKSGKRNVFSIKASYHVVFHLDNSLPDEFFILYSRSSLPLQTYPYFRELVNSMISRMGLPPLVLGLRKFLMGEGS
jgi:preprotein translocase subunit SecB